MNLLGNELKKIWQPRVLIILGLLAVLTYFAFLNPIIESMNSLLKYNPYGTYQNDMFDRYGNTLDPAELADFDIPGKQTTLVTEMNQIISQSPTFAKYQVNSFAEFQQLNDPNQMESRSETFLNQLSQMNQELSFSSETSTVEDWFNSPLMRYETLEAIQRDFADQSEQLDYLISQDHRPVIVSAARDLRDTQTVSLIPYGLTKNFSLYAAIAGIFAVLAVIVLTVPLLITDRYRRINQLQYATQTGRKIFYYQFLTVIISSLGLSCFVCFLYFSLFFQAGYSKYWMTPIQSYQPGSFYFTSITFGTYAIQLASLIVLSSLTAACLIFALSRYSINIIGLFIKSVPATLGLIAFTFISLHQALSNNNGLFLYIGRGYVSNIEMNMSGLMAILGLAIGLIIVRREKRLDLI